MSGDANAYITGALINRLLDAWTGTPNRDPVTGQTLSYSQRRRALAITACQTLVPEVARRFRSDLTRAHADIERLRRQLEIVTAERDAALANRPALIVGTASALRTDPLSVWGDE